MDALRFKFRPQSHAVCFHFPTVCVFANRHVRLRTNRDFTRRLMAGLLIKSNVAGIDLIEFGR